LFDLKGKMIARARVPMGLYISDSPDYSEQEPEVFWQNVCKACHLLWEMEGVRKETIVGVTITTQRSTVINVDEHGNPLRRAITWMDNRRASGQKPVGGLWGLAFRAAGMSETVAYLQAECESNWIRSNQPEIWAKTSKYLYLSGYLTYRITGKFVDSAGCQVGYMPFDYKSLEWAKPSDWKWQAVPMDRRVLPDLVQPTGRLGEVTKEASEATGIPAGLPVIAAAADKACEVIGAGCLEPYVGCISYGTTATINTTNKKYVEVIPLIPPYPSAVPNAYSLEIQIYRGYWMVSWFLQEFGDYEKRKAGEMGVTPESLFEEQVAKIPPGNIGLMLQPYWSPGLKIPGPEAKGAIIGFSDIHSRAHIYRAIFEGMAYALREAAERTSKRSGTPITQLRIAGGGSQSDVAMQITADIFGIPASRPHIYEASGLGAAIDTAVGLKLYPDFETAVKEMTHIGQTFEPDMKAHEIYDQLYRRVYCKMYKGLKPMYEEIRKITGYPPPIR
jgi:sugar (pentulose or hexulose) kinase